MRVDILRASNNRAIGLFVFKTLRTAATIRAGTDLDLRPVGSPPGVLHFAGAGSLYFFFVSEDDGKPVFCSSLRFLASARRLAVR